MNLYLLHYNNYYNRIVKRESSLDGYLPYQLGNVITRVNFIPGDYVDTTQVVNWNYEHPDYMLAVDEDGDINSRWFVLSAERTRAGQLLLTLHRDLVADFYDAVINAPCFIEKATLSDDDPGIFNSEDMTFNQILTDSTPLKDETQSPWLVGYFAKNNTIENLDINYETDLVPDFVANNLAEVPFYSYLNKTYTNYSSIAIDLISKTSQGTVMLNSFNRYGATPPAAKSVNIIAENGFTWLTPSTTEENREGYYAEMLEYANHTPLVGGYKDSTASAKYFTPYMVQSISSTTWDTINEQVKIYTGNAPTNEIDKYVNKILKLQNSGKYYRVILEVNSTVSNYTQPIPSGNIPNIDNIIRSAYNQAVTQYAKDYTDLAVLMTANVSTSGSSNDYVCAIRTAAGSEVTLKLKELTDIKVSAKLTTSTNHLHLSDAPYDMFCMPYSDDVTIHTKDGDYQSNRALSLAVMNAIAEKYSGSSNLYDIQLLPYCPLRNYIAGSKKLDLTLSSSLSVGVDQYYYVTDETGASNLAVFMYCSTSQGTFDIGYNISISDYKVQSQCDMYRLCSPNYSSVFEFNAAKNRGVGRFNVDFAYKPYSPYIHVNPYFKAEGLYGLDRNEPRGLVCGGDFSITIINDQFSTYELQNKNYQLSFQRQIDTMEVKNRVQTGIDIASAASGALGAGAAGAGAGMMLGGPVGALAGIGTGLISAGAGVADVLLNRKMRQLDIDLTKDLYGYNMGNIQALPNTIAKVTAFNPNNKIFPVLEYYTCTEMEKEALRNKIKYNGMTVMRIGTIQDFRKVNKTYIKGKIIRFAGENINIELEEDYHIATAIANEINQGVFI